MKKFEVKKVAAVLSVAALVGLNGCKLSDNSQRAADNSEKAAKNSTDLLELNQTAFGDGRQGGSRISRVDALDLLNKVTSLESKLVQAGAYYNALEFQLYKSTGFREDDAGKQERLFQVAISETTKIIKDFDVITVDATKMLSDVIFPERKVTTPTGEEKVVGNPNYLAARNYAAMAMAMHNYSERQSDASARYNFKKMNFLEVVEKVLKNKVACETDPMALNVVPAYVFEGLKVSSDLEKMLQVRMNVMAGTALMNLGSPIKMDPEKGLVANTDAVKIKAAYERLAMAAQARGILAAAGLQMTMFADVKGGIQQLSGALSKIPQEQTNTDTMLKKLVELNDETLKHLL